MSTADDTAAESANVESEHEAADEELEEFVADEDHTEEMEDGDEEHEEEIGDEEGVEMFMTDNWDVVDEASGSEHDDGGEIDHDLQIDDSDIPTGPKYDAQEGDMEDELEASYDEEFNEEEESLQEEMGDSAECDQKKDHTSSTKQTDAENEEYSKKESTTSDIDSKDTETSKEKNATEITATSEENVGEKEGGKVVNAEGNDAKSTEVTGDDADSADNKESTDVKKDETKEKDEGEDKAVIKKAEKKTEGDKKETDKSKSDKKDVGKSAKSKAKAEVEAEARAEARAKAEARRKADHEAMTKEWDNMVVTMSDVEVRHFKTDDFFLCLCKAKEIHIDFEDDSGMRTLGKMKVAFNASSPARYESLVKSLANIRLLGIKIDECSEHLLKKTNDFCRRLGLQEGHPRDRSLFLKNLPEDTTELSLKEYIPNMVRACVARKPGGKVVGWAVVEMETKAECLSFLHKNKFIKIGKHQVRVSRMTAIGKPEIPTTPRVQQWLWGKLFYLSDRRREYWNKKQNNLQNSRSNLDRRIVGRFSRGNFRDNKFLNTRGRRPGIRGTGLRSNMNLGMRSNMGIPGLNVSLATQNMGGMGMGPSNMGSMMGQGMGGNMGGLNMGSAMGMGNMGMASGMGAMGSGMMGNMGGVGMGMSGNSMGGLNMNQRIGQMGSDIRGMRTNVSSMSRSRSRDRLDRSLSPNRNYGSERSFSDQRQRRSTDGTMDTGRFSNRRGSPRDGGMRRTSDINVRSSNSSRGNRGSFSHGGSYTGGRGGNYGGRRDSRSSFGRDGSFDRDRRSSRDSGDFSRDHKDYNKGGDFSDHSDYEEEYNRGGSRYSRDDDYDRASRSSDRMGQSSAPRRLQQVTKRRERSPMWDDRDYDNSPSMEQDDDSRGRGMKKTASRRDLSEKLGVVLSNERQGVQDDRAMVALLQTALDAMQKKEGSKSPARATPSSSLGRPVTSPSLRRSNPIPLKRRKPYDEDLSQLQKRSRSEFSSQGQSRGGSSHHLGHSSTMGSGGYSGVQTSQQYRSPSQNQYSKPSLPRGGMSRGGRGSMRGTARGNARGTGRGGAGRVGYNQGGSRSQMGMGSSSQGMTRSYEDY